MKTFIKICTLFIFFGLSCSGSESSKKTDLQSLLPKSGDVPGWSTSGEPLEFAGDDLWSLINGGAEIYHEYGFEKVLAQEYSDESGHSVSVELYQMTGPASAYGIYTFKSGDEGEILNLTNGGLLEDYYLNFWKDRFLVTITGFDSDRETIEGLKAIAAFIDGKIAEPGNKPSLPNVLPAEGMKELSLKYFLGNLGLFNSYSFARSDIFGFREAVKADYEQGYSVYILKMESADECSERFAALHDEFENSAKFSGLSADNDRIRMTDRDGRKIVLKKFNEAVLISIGNNSFADTVLDNIVF